MENETTYVALILRDSQGRTNATSIRASTDAAAWQKARNHFSEETGSIMLYRYDIGTGGLERVVE